MLKLLIIILSAIVLYTFIRDIITAIREYNNDKDDDDNDDPTIPMNGNLIQPV